MNARTLVLLAASAIVALAAWPTIIHSRTSAATAASDPTALLTPAPVMSDYLLRDKNITFLEGRVRVPDQLNTRMLAAEYLQRYRERQDVGDVIRSEAFAHQSLKEQPLGNIAGDFAVASALVTLHRFKEAQHYVADARRYVPGAGSEAIGVEGYEGAIDLEIGDYVRVKSIVADIERAHMTEDVNTATTVARFAEETGDIGQAERLYARTMRVMDSNYEMPAERRAWYHFRLGEIRFEHGDNVGAMQSERDALAIFPSDPLALNALARIALANKKYDEAEDAAKRGAAIVPNPETLGTLADAQLVNGETAAAAATLAQFDAVEKIGNAQRVNDRLIAVYLADHDLRPADAYAIARRELDVRDDVYTEDTLAWCAAKAGKWDVARTAMAKALRFDTEDPRMHYHAGVIAQHFGDRGGAKAQYTRALALNPNFSATQADDARKEVAAR